MSKAWLVGCGRCSVVVAASVLVACAAGDGGGFPGIDSQGFGTGGEAGEDGDDDGDTEEDSDDGDDDGSGGGDQDGDDDGDDDDGDETGGDGSDDNADGPTCVPADEVCDGMDNDCDDEIDEDDPMLGADCSTGLEGICADGTYVCSAGGALECEATEQPTDEECNGLDDDCDGVEDNGDPGGGTDCDTALDGVCADGVTECSAGGTIDCVQLVEADDEDCNGLDDDCDGSTDEGISGVGNACTTGMPGVCSAGTFECNGATGVVACEPNTTASANEVCGNGLDDDCDGTADDGCASSCVHDECDEGSALTSGCSPCVTTVCAADPFCCDTEWDSICVDEAASLCGLSCAGSCAHDVCDVGVALDPSCDACVELVCILDAFCCDTEWDIICVDEAASFCGAPC